jgi:hypothetical protein
MKGLGNLLETMAFHRSGIEPSGAVHPPAKGQPPWSNAESGRWFPGDENIFRSSNDEHHQG